MSTSGRFASRALAPLLLVAAGCLPCTEGLRKVGLRYERPVAVSPLTGPHLATYVDSTNTRVAVMFRVELQDGGQADRWINLDLRRLRRVVPASFPEKSGRNRCVAYSVTDDDHLYELSDDYVRRLISRRPGWRLSKLRALNVLTKKKVFKAAKPAKAAAQPLPQNARVCVIMNVPETGGRDVVFFGFPDREYRTWWGYAAQGLLPATVALDVTIDTVIVVTYVAGAAVQVIGR